MAHTFSALILFCLLSCTCADDPVVARVGQFPIYQKDVDFRNQIIHIYYPQEERNLGFEQLTRMFTYAQILVNNGHTIDENVLKKEKERIDKSTLMPEKLEQIKSIFGGDKDAYLRVFILPTYAERIIYYDFFLKHPKIQERTRRIAQEFLDEASKNPDQFEELAKKKGLHAGKFKVSYAEGLEWKRPKEMEDGPQSPQSNIPLNITSEMQKRQAQKVSEEGKRWIEDIIKPLKKGEVSSKIIDQKESWLVVRYLFPVAKAKETFQMQGISFPKENYEEWLAAETKKVVIKDQN